MDKKQLSILLSKLRPLESLDINLEQYQSEGELAADILWKAFLNNDIKDKVIADLGCGNGIFGIGSLILGAKKVYFVDLDKKSIKIAKENCKSLGLKSHFLIVDIKDFNKKVDTAIMNPPFGVQKEHSDRPFLEKALETSSTIYSIHKIESKKFIEKIASNKKFVVKEIYKYKFLIKQTYKFHKQKSHYVDVGCWCLKKEK